MQGTARCRPQQAPNDPGTRRCPVKAAPSADAAGAALGAGGPQRGSLDGSPRPFCPGVRCCGTSPQSPYSIPCECTRIGLPPLVRFSGSRAWWSWPRQPGGPHCRPTRERGTQVDRASAMWIGWGRNSKVSRRCAWRWAESRRIRRKRRDTRAPPASLHWAWSRSDGRECLSACL